VIVIAIAADYRSFPVVTPGPLTLGSLEKVRKAPLLTKSCMQWCRWLSSLCLK